jgi:ectoine hydroxylase
MQLTQAQIREYQETGCLAIPALFSPDEVAVLCEAFDQDSTGPGPHRIMEDGGDRVRALYASHQRRPEFATLVRSPRILGPVHQLLTPDVYVYQFKINAKSAFGGDKWSWHQDYMAWQIADNLPAPRLVNVGFFLDEVNEFNGPVMFVPGSHRAGLVRDSGSAHARSGQHLDPDDIALKPEQMADLVDRNGIISAKGPAGSVVFFHPEIVHGSAANMSPYPRRLLIVTYNDVTNPPEPVGEARPEYVVGRETTPLQVVDEPLARLASGAQA